MGETSNLTYARKVKDELVETPQRQAHCLAIELGAALLSAGRFRPDVIALSTAHAGFADLLGRQFAACYAIQPVVQIGREIITVAVRDMPDIRWILQDLAVTYGFDPETGSFKPPARLPACCRQAALRAFFLACGSLSDPCHAYHLEFSVRRPDAATWLMALLASAGILAGSLERHGHAVVYCKDGQMVSDFLLQSGAHQSMLAFETLRVEKEMRNSVNRVVNCDSANTQRLANASARQLELFEELADAGLVGQLPEVLVLALQARLEHPDLSLKELGESMDPPLGKSGMNHRLQKLEIMAAELLARYRPPSGPNRQST